MKKICVCFFSGTGMTKYVVDRLINEFEKYQITVKCFSIEDIQVNQVDLSKFDLLGIAYPVHAFNAPEIVINFVNQLSKSNGTDTFIIATMGENNAINFASSNTLIKKLRRKGYRVFFNSFFEMPCNYIIKYKTPKVNLILDNVEREIPHTAKEIIHLTAHEAGGNMIARFLNVIGKSEWLGARVIGKFFYANSDCTQCGRCVKKCPKHNIVKKGKAVHFKWNCCSCMRCIYQCPMHAISIHQPFKFIRFTDWYDSDIFTRHKKFH